MPSAPPAPFTHRQILIIFGGLMAGLFLAALDQTVVATALPTIVGELGGLEYYSWVVTAYLLSATVSTPIYGKLSDMYGRRALFQAAILIFLVGSLLAGIAQGMLQLIIFRGLQGVGAGGLMALTFAVIGDVVSPRERGRYIGLLGGAWAFASVIGPRVKPIPSWNSPRLLMAYAAFFFDVVVSIFSSRFIASRSLGRCR